MTDAMWDAPRRDVTGATWDPTAGAWIVGEKSGLQVAVVAYMFTGGLIIGHLTLTSFYVDRWCYHSVQEAVDAAHAWLGEYPETEPSGWHRHPRTGRRRDGDREWVNL